MSENDQCYFGTAQESFTVRKGFCREFAPVRRGLLSPEVLTWKVLTSAIMTRNLQMERLNADTRLVEDDISLLLSN